MDFDDTNNDFAAALASADSEKQLNRVSAEQYFVNLKSRATDHTFPRGVLSKQWRRTLHNVAARDMAAHLGGAARFDG